MNVVCFAFGTALAAFAVHLVIWRVRVPRRAMRMLVAIFTAGLFAAVVCGRLWLPDFGWGESVYGATLYGVLGLTYLLIYTGIECDSPTLSLAHYIAQGGVLGRTAAEIDAFIRARPFVQSRLAQLEQGGFVVRRKGYLELAEKGTLVFDVGEFYRRLMGRTTHGG